MQPWQFDPDLAHGKQFGHFKSVRSSADPTASFQKLARSPESSKIRELILEVDF
jgi:hypothetical protein